MFSGQRKHQVRYKFDQGRPSQQKAKAHRTSDFLISWPADRTGAENLHKKEPALCALAGSSPIELHLHPKQNPPHMYTQTHTKKTFTHTHTHTQIRQTYTHTQTHAHTGTCASLVHTHIQTHTHTHINKTHAHAYTHTHTHTHIHTNKTD
jgi:hypothetical protein